MNCFNKFEWDIYITPKQFFPAIVQEKYFSCNYAGKEISNRKQLPFDTLTSPTSNESDVMIFLTFLYFFLLVLL